MSRPAKKRRQNRIQVYNFDDSDVQHEFEEFSTLSNTTHRTRTVMTAIPGKPLDIAPSVPTLPDEPDEQLSTTWSSDTPDLGSIKVKGKARRYENSV